MLSHKHRFAGFLLLLTIVGITGTGCYETHYQRQYHHHSRRYYDNRHMPPPPGVNFEMDVHQR